MLTLTEDVKVLRRLGDKAYKEKETEQTDEERREK